MLSAHYFFFSAVKYVFHFFQMAIMFMKIDTNCDGTVDWVSLSSDDIHHVMQCYIMCNNYIHVEVHVCTSFSRM